MRASKLQTFWIMFYSGCSTCYWCSKAIWAGWRKKDLRQHINHYARVWSGKLLKTLKVEVKVNNPTHQTFDEQKPYIIMSNHTSLYDIPIIFTSISGTVRMLAKRELTKIPIFGNALKNSEFPLIDRKNRRQAIKDLKHARDLMQSGILLWVAPEGTRSKTGELLPFKKGGFITAIQAKATIIPIGIKGASELLPKNSWKFHLQQKIQVNIGQPIDASVFKQDDKEQLMQQVREEILKLLN